MKTEHKSSYGYESKYKEDYSFGGNGVSLNQAVAIFGAIENGIITESESVAIASLIDQGIV